jgi:predicted transglutaminase-like cysteine proteinase
MKQNLKRLSSEICNIFANKLTSLTEKQAEHLNLLNNSMNFYIQLKDNDKAIYNARETLKYLKQITKDG